MATLLLVCFPELSILSVQLRRLPNLRLGLAQNHGQTDQQQERAECLVYRHGILNLGLRSMWSSRASSNAELLS
jgi:hypothetical protein